MSVPAAGVCKVFASMRRGWGCPLLKSWLQQPHHRTEVHPSAKLVLWESAECEGAESVARREEEQGTKRVIISRGSTEVRRRRKRTKMRYSIVEQITTLQPVERTMAEQLCVS